METILRITKKSKNHPFQDDDFNELGFDDEFLFRREAKSAPRRKSIRAYRYFWPGFVLAVLLLSGLCVASYWTIKHYFFPPGPVNIFVEMKVIDEDGHPVAGAGIFHSKKRIGVSDSFGEWSRFMKAPLGSTFTLMIRKESGSNVMGALKTIGVPLYLQNGLEPHIKSNVHLTRNWTSPDPVEEE